MTSATVDNPNVHLEDPDLIGRRWRTGVRLLIFADASFVAALLFSYFYLRGLNTENAWLHPGQATALRTTPAAISQPIPIEAVAWPGCSHAFSVFSPRR